MSVKKVHFFCYVYINVGIYRYFSKHHSIPFSKNCSFYSANSEINIFQQLPDISFSLLITWNIYFNYQPNNKNIFKAVLDKNLQKTWTGNKRWWRIMNLNLGYILAYIHINKKHLSIWSRSRQEIRLLRWKSNEVSISLVIRKYR